MIVDTHCHIFLDNYENIDELIEDIRRENIILIVNGISPSTNREVIDLVKKYDIVYGTLGFHPSEVSNIIEEDFKELENQLAEDKILGIGEIGLDYYWTNDNKEEQIKLFTKQLNIASKNNYPVIIHNRDSTKDMIDILSNYKLKGIMHSFSDTLDVAKSFINMGYKLGIGGIVTFKNSNLKEVLKDIDMENIVFETDSPYLTPEPNRGKKNYPQYIKLVVKKVAEIKNITIEETLNIGLKNTLSLFDFKQQK